LYLTGRRGLRTSWLIVGMSFVVPFGPRGKRLIGTLARHPLDLGRGAFVSDTFSRLEPALPNRGVPQSLIYHNTAPAAQTQGDHEAFLPRSGSRPGIISHAMGGKSGPTAILARQRAAGAHQQIAEASKIHHAGEMSSTSVHPWVASSIGLKYATRFGTAIAVYITQRSRWTTWRKELMNALRNKRNLRQTQPALERLDLRLAPTSMSMGAVLASTLRVEARQVHRLQTSLERAQPGSRHERTLVHRIAAEERMMGRQAVRLDQIVARAGGTGTGSQIIFPANVSPTLGVIYNAYEQNPGGFPANLSGAASLVVIQGSNVGIQVHDSNPADFNQLLTELENDGMQVTSSSAYYGTIVGMLPISQLPAVATLTEGPSITPLFRPLAN
jgi:hypothetical protein